MDCVSVGLSPCQAEGGRNDVTVGVQKMTISPLFDKAFFPNKGTLVPVRGDEDSTCRGCRIMAELHVQAAVSAVLQHPLLKGHPSVSFTVLKCCYQIELNHLHSNWSTTIHSG